MDLNMSTNETDESEGGSYIFNSTNRAHVMDLFGMGQDDSLMRDGNDSGYDGDGGSQECTINEEDEFDAWPTDDESHGSPNTWNENTHSHIDGESARNENETRENVESEGDELERLRKGPVMGMVFATSDDLYKFYKAHSRLKGFCIRKRNVSAKYIMLTCHLGGQKGDAERSKRVGCQARVNAKCEDGVWIVTSVEDNHCHDCYPGMSRLMTGHRYIPNRMKRSIEANDLAGITIAKNFRAHQVQHGGPEELTFVERDCRNFIRKCREIFLEDGDAKALTEFFTKLNKTDRDFFYLVDWDNDGRLRNVIWIHPHCKVAYQEFGDVVSFDTTYLVNVYKMPFATFVGVNHHNQSILLGCALLSYEDAETYKWLFSTFLDAMGGQAPKCILTDQDESMRIALDEVMPRTVHRLCVWHIYTKYPYKIHGTGRTKAARKKFISIIRDSICEEEFTQGWNEFLIEHQLEGNNWLRSLFDLRLKWVPLYLNEHFSAGMKSTQRSESMHAFFDGYINPKSTLTIFARRYEQALAAKRELEIKEEVINRLQHHRLMTPFKWEEQLERLLTRNMYKKVREQIGKAFLCEYQVVESDEYGVEVYSIHDKSLISIDRPDGYYYSVRYKASEEELKCNCMKFETWGIICCHIMRVLSLKNIKLLNERYIPRRWRRDVDRPHLARFLKYGYPQMTDEFKRYQEFLIYFDDCADLVLKSTAKKRGDIFIAKLLQLKSELSDIQDEPEAIEGEGAIGEAGCEGTEGAPHGQNVTPSTILDPHIAKTKGRPRSSRYKSVFERLCNKRSKNSDEIEVQAAGRSGRGRGRGKRVSFAAESSSRTRTNRRNYAIGSNLVGAQDGSQASGLVLELGLGSGQMGNGSNETPWIGNRGNDIMHGDNGRVPNHFNFI